MTQTQLIRISVAGDSLALHGYADTLVYLPASSASEKPTLIAIRLGGDPAVTQALTFSLSGGGEFTAELNGESLVLDGKKMRYKRKMSTAAPYAQALLTAEDEEIQGKEKAQGREGIKTYVATRVCYLYCPPGDHTYLFQELQKKTSVPMLPEFEDYVLDECRCRGILTPLTVLSTTEEFEAWRLVLTRDDKNLIGIVNDGLKSGTLHIPGAASSRADVFENVSTISQYLNTFGAQIAEKIKSRFAPLYDPTAQPPSTEVQRIDANIYRHTGYHLYDAQMAVAESVKRRIDQGRPAIIVAECGSGKTKIGAAALAASQREEGGKKFNIVLCPSHVAEKWVRELHETVPNVRAAVVRTIRELKTVYADYQRKSTNVYAVISKESARDGYVRYPAVNIGHAGRQTVFRCPDCGEIVEQPLNDGGATYWVTADASFFLRENSKNHKCKSCGSPLWAPLTDGAAPKSWAKIGSFGYVYRKELRQYCDLTNNPAILEKLDELSRQGGESASTAPRAPRRYPLSTYIRKKMSGKIDGLIADELHQYNNDSGQGDAMAEISGAARKVIGMTATLINGYAAGIFYLLYRLFPRAMQLDEKQYRDVSAFAREYGIVESALEIDLDRYHDKRRTAVHKRREKMLPGVSPLIYTRFLMESAVFLSLADMGKDLPEYEEIPIPLLMPADILRAYTVIEASYKKIAMGNLKLANKVWSAFLNLLTVYPDQPYGQPVIRSPLDGAVLCTPPETAVPGAALEKDVKILELVRRKMAAGENVLIYTSWTRIDTQQKLLGLLEKEGIPTEILLSKVAPTKREAWLDDKLRKGGRVLITNPTLVETGLDLNAFTSLIYYNVNYNPFTLRQSSRRSWRINQTAPRIEVYFFFYKNSVQERAIHLMATKLAVAGIIEGHISDEGLLALSDCRDVSSQLAKELAQGVKNDVNDMAALFKRMAFLKEPETETSGENQIRQPATPPAHATVSPTVQPVIPDTRPESISHITENVRFAFALPNARKKSEPGDAAQLTLFDVA